MGIGSKFQKFKDKVFDRTRKLIPNELADIAVKAAPFVAMIPGQQGTAALMRGLGRFDQRGDPIDALKQAGMMYVGGKIVSPYTGNIIPGLEGNTYEGIKGLMQAGKDIGSGTMDLFKGGGPSYDLSGMGTGGGGTSSGGGIVDTIKSLAGKGKDALLEGVLGEDKKFQMGDIGRFLGDPGKTIPLTMIASYIKEKFFPDEDQDSFDAKFAEAMARRGENVEGYLRQYGPFDPRRDPTENPYTQEEIDQFAKDKTIEYRNVAASGGLMSIPRENYFLGGAKAARMVNPNPDFERASKVTPDDILNVFKKQFNEGVFFKGRRLPKSIEAYHLANPEMPLPVGTTRRSLDNLGRIPKASKVSSDDIMTVFKEKFDGGNFFGKGGPRLALPMGRKVSSTSPFKNVSRPMPLGLGIPPSGNYADNFSNRKGLGKLMISLLKDANFDREEAAMGGRMNYASGSEGIMMASNPDPMDERNQVLEMMAMQTFGKPLRDLSDDQIIELEEMFDDFISSGQPLPSDPTKPINPFAPKPTGPALPDKQMAFMEDDYETEFMRLVGEFMEQGFSQEEAIEAARDELARIGSKFMADGGRVNYAMGGDTPEENALQAAGIEGLDININPKGITELDMRETGGFIPPVGVKEKEDDIPAMLSNNEFVFTADAVKGMGDGDVDKGAERMYDMMKKLENGGRV